MKTKQQMISEYVERKGEVIFDDDAKVERVIQLCQKLNIDIKKFGIAFGTGYKQGANLLAPLLIEAWDALEDSCWCGSRPPGDACDGCWTVKKLEEALGEK